MEYQKTVFVVLVLLSLFALDVSAITRKEAFSQHLKSRRSGSVSKTSADELSNDVTATAAAAPAGLKDEDRIRRLPGQPPVKFDQYGGYITIDESAGKALYYYLVEAQDPAKAHQLPLVLWLNGGPGCSSLGFGAMQELGPFRVGSDGKTLFRNKYAWNQAANVLFLESPAGVGFSYSNKTETTGDTKAAADNLAFLLNWVERFPEYKGRDFYIAGESYAGHYVPQLADNIVRHNNNLKAKNNKVAINLKGIMIGNAVINDETDEVGMYEFWESHALISRQTLQGILKTCDFSPNGTSESEECNQHLNEAEQPFTYMDMYNIYYPVCQKTEAEALTALPEPMDIDTIDPCTQYYTRTYLNREDVQAAMHANVTGFIKYPWEGCGGVDYAESTTTVLPILNDLTQNGVRILVFSGDVDGRVPITSTLNSLAAMKRTIISPWTPWFLAGEVGGFTQDYQGNITFTSVRGAGHQVPSYMPARVLSLFSHFLSKTPLPIH